MKPRERLTQGQYSRLWCRKNDHRDILFYNETTGVFNYHNGLYWSTVDQDKVLKENLAWAKYPKTEVLFFDSLGNDGGCFGCMDIDRQFAFAQGLDNYTHGIFQLDDITVVVSWRTERSNRIYVTEDGTIWQEVLDKPTIPITQGNVFNAHKFGYDNSLVTFTGDDYWHGGGTKMNMITWHFYKDEETDRWKCQGQQAKVTNDDTIDWSTDLRYMGAVENGVVVCKQVFTNYPPRWQLYVYRINQYGNATRLSDPVPEFHYSPWLDGYGNDWVTCQQGSRMFCATRVEFRANDSDPYTEMVKVYMSMDEGLTWNETIFYSAQGANTAYGICSSVQICLRDDRVFLILGQRLAKDGHNEFDVRMWDTFTGTSWDEIPLPKWLDLPILNEFSGKSVQPYSSDTIRIAVRPSESSDYQARLFDMIPRDRKAFFSDGTNNIMYSDGKIVKDKIFFVFGWDGGLHAYFDSRYLAESTKAFAWMRTVASNYTDAVAGDYVIQYDYCAPNGSPTPTTDPLGYNYYVYDKEQYEYIKIYEADIPHYPTYHIVEVERLPNIGARNVIYKVPYWTSETDWSDNDDYHNE